MMVAPLRCRTPQKQALMVNKNVHRKILRDKLVKEFVIKVSSPIAPNKRIKTMRQVLKVAPHFTHKQLTYLWRGLYYCIWYTEMGKGCEEMCRLIAESECDKLLLSGFEAMARDWYGMDNYRIDKYSYLVRLMTNSIISRQVTILLNNFSQQREESDSRCKTSEANVTSENTSKRQKLDNEVLSENDLKTKKSQIDEKSANDEDNKRCGSDSEDISQAPTPEQIQFNSPLKGKKKKINDKTKVRQIKVNIVTKAHIISQILTVIESAAGLTLHFCDIYLDEMLKVLNERFRWPVEEKAHVTVSLLVPFINLIATTNDDRLRNAITELFGEFRQTTLAAESIEGRKLILRDLTDKLFLAGSQKEVGKKNRGAIYRLISSFKQKLALVEGRALCKTKVEEERVKHKSKKISRYVSNTPFVRSLVPVAVV